MDRVLIVGLIIFIIVYFDLFNLYTVESFVHGLGPPVSGHLRSQTGRLSNSGVMSKTTYTASANDMVLGGGRGGSNVSSSSGSSAFNQSTDVANRRYLVLEVSANLYETDADQRYRLYLEKPGITDTGITGTGITDGAKYLGDLTRRRPGEYSLVFKTDDMSLDMYSIVSVVMTRGSIEDPVVVLSGTI